MSCLLGGLLLMLVAAMPLQAQVDTGSILGTIYDTVAAVIPQATVSIRNEDTGLTQVQKTKADGTYLFPVVKVGTYTVTVMENGFESIQQQHVHLSIQQQLAVDLHMKIGGVNSTVEVTTGQTALQTQEASVGQIISEEEINNLPLNGRNYTLLAQLAPGTTTTVFDSGHGEVQSGTFTANGMITVFNNYLLDGVSNNNMSADFGNGNSYTLKPPPDGLSEFKVETANYSAEYGRSGGAVINAVTKSGQNRLFGDVWEYNRNRYFDANDYFLNHAHQSRPKYNRNQFGFSLGGPVSIPHLYSGHDRTFFFVDYEGQRIRQGEPFTSSVPTALEQSSGFTNYSDLFKSQTQTQTDILGRVTKIGQVFDPATTRYLGKGTADPITGISANSTGYVREPFANNVIPGSRIAPNSAKLLALFPLPNANNGNIATNYVSSPVLQQSADGFDSRIDENFSANDQLFARGSYSLIPRNIPAPCSTLALCGQSATVGTESDKVLGVAIGETHIFSPRLVNEIRIGYNRIHMDRVQLYGTQAGLNAQYGIPGIPDGGENGGLAQIKISGLSELGEHNNIPLDEIGAEAQYNENVSLELGHHSLRFGAQYSRFKNAIGSAQFPHGYFGFSGTYTDQPSGNTANTGIAQFAIEPILSTVPNCTVIQSAATGTACQTYNYVGGSNQIQGSPITQQDYRRPYYGAYFTDTWKVTPTFTATLGARLEHFEIGVDHAGHGANFVPGFANKSGQAMYLIDDRSKNVPLSPSFTALMAQENINIVYTSNHQLGTLAAINPSPRIGLAWQPSPRAVFRAAYGIFFAGIYARGDGYNPGDDYPFSFAINITSSTQGGLGSDSNGTIGPMDKGLANVPLVPSLAQGYQIGPRGNQYNSHIPYVQAMNFTFQYELTSSQSFQVAYVGTQSRRIESNIGSNKVDLLLPTNVAVTPVSPGPTCKDAGLTHDGGVGQTTSTGSYYDQYPCLAQNNIYTWNEGSNNYNSLQTKYEKNYGHGVSLIADYTWEKLLGYGSDSNVFGSIGYRGPLIPGFGMQGDYQNGDFESENIFHSGGVFQIPVGYGRRFMGHKGLLDTFIGGWNLNGIFTYQSGQPVNIGCVTGRSNGAGCFALPDKSLIYAGGVKTVAHYLNAAAFSDPTSTVQTIGQQDFSPLGSKPGQAFGPPFHRGDLGIAKVFHLPGENVLQFRAEAFNLTNTPNFGQPGTLTYTSTSFAQITSTRDSPNDAREMQFALKYIFGHGHQE